jgi:hypothetical protein
MKTSNGEDRMGLAGAGRSIEFKEGAMSFGSWMTSSINNGEAGERANKMNLQRDDDSIASCHTQGKYARTMSSAEDLKGDIPNLVISRLALYPMVPGRDTYLRLDSAVCK